MLEAKIWVFSSDKFVVKVNFESINKISVLILLLSILFDGALLPENRNSPTNKSKKPYVIVNDFKTSLKFTLLIYPFLAIQDKVFSYSFKL